VCAALGFDCLVAPLAAAERIEDVLGAPLAS
jgi:elongation factor P--beta-lysine ligase